MLEANLYARTIFDDIDAGEPLISARAIAKLPPFAVDGRAAHIASIYRAFSPGWRHSSGERIQLESIDAVGGKSTTRSALLRFMRKANSTTVRPATAAASHRRASSQMAAAGL